MTADAAALHTNFAEWIKTASLAEILVILDGLEDELLQRHQPATSLIAQASAMLRREMGR